MTFKQKERGNCLKITVNSSSFFVCECQSAVFEFQFSSFFHSPKCQINNFFARLLSSQYFLACRALNPPWCIKAGQGDESIEEGERQCRQDVDWMVGLSDLWMPDMGHQSMQQCSQCRPFQTADTCSSSGGRRENHCEHHGHNHLNTGSVPNPSELSYNVHF